MRVRSGAIEVEGLTELQRALKQLGDVEASAELRGANKEAAGFVADASRGRAVSEGSVAAKIAPSIRASAGMSSAAVAFGGVAYPMAAGAEFGGQGRPTTQQFRPWRGTGPGAGYIVYPTINEKADQVLAPYEQAIDEITRKAGLA